MAAITKICSEISSVLVFPSCHIIYENDKKIIYSNLLDFCDAAALILSTLF